MKYTIHVETNCLEFDKTEVLSGIKISNANNLIDAWRPIVAAALKKFQTAHYEDYCKAEEHERKACRALRAEHYPRGVVP